MSATKADQSKTNRLINEKSPYLQQHATNPVDWYPWGEEALARAKKENKPIFLSIGYSTCHWCHVMAHESFEDPAVGAIMNEHFVNIKVDREERPDIDAIYMEAVQILTGSGGWPMSVWLTPELEPFYGGTYFPPEDRYGRPGFTTVLKTLGDLWKTKRDRIKETTDQLMQALTHSTSAGHSSGIDLPGVKESLDQAYNNLWSNFDTKEGGFGPPPKFPMPVYMDFLLRYHARTGQKEALDMVDLTLKKMIGGGIYDQLGGGFARYSTDALWVVPHFEKMLYDNAQLLDSAVELYQITRDETVKEAIHETVTYIFRDMTHPDGAFYSAEDADSEGKEGTFYLWKLVEINKVLGEPLAEPFIHRYGMSVNGNFMDPHTQEVGNNILVRSHSIEDTAKKFNESPAEMKKKLAAAEKRLFDVRSRRIRPHLDDKILAGWNGLMISALSKVGVILNDAPALEAATKAATFIQDKMYDKKEKQLYRRWREGERKILAHQIDYALLVQGLLDLFEATGDMNWLSWAMDLHETHNNLFLDQEKGGYYMNVPRKDLLFRIKDDRDNVIPSGNSVAVLNGFRLGDLAQKKGWIDIADKTMHAFAKSLNRHPLALAKMLTAYDFEANGHIQLIIVGPEGSEGVQALKAEMNKSFLPQKIVILIDPEKNQEALSAMNPFFKSIRMQDGKPTAYLCIQYACKKPTNDPQELRAQLDSIVKQSH